MPRTELAAFAICFTALASSTRAAVYELGSVQVGDNAVLDFSIDWEELAPLNGKADIAADGITFPEYDSFQFPGKTCECLSRGAGESPSAYACE